MKDYQIEQLKEQLVLKDQEIKKYINQLGTSSDVRGLFRETLPKTYFVINRQSSKGVKHEEDAKNSIDFSDLSCINEAE